MNWSNVNYFEIVKKEYFFRQPYFQVGQQRLSQDIGEVSYARIGQQKRQPVQLMKSQISLLQTSNNNKQLKSVNYDSLFTMDRGGYNGAITLFLYFKQG